MQATERRLSRCSRKSEFEVHMRSWKLGAAIVVALPLVLMSQPGRGGMIEMDRNGTTEAADRARLLDRTEADRHILRTLTPQRQQALAAWMEAKRAGE